MTTTLSVTVAGLSATPYVIVVTPSSYSLESSGGLIIPIVNVSNGSGVPVSGVSVTIANSTLGISQSGVTDSNGNVSISIEIPPNASSSMETYVFNITSSGGSTGSGGAPIPSGTYSIEYAATYSPSGFQTNGTQVGTGNVTVSDGSALGYYANAPYYINANGDYYTLVSSAVSGGTHTMVIKYGGLSNITVSDGSISI